jgi:hypothetical protein
MPEIDRTENRAPNADTLLGVLLSGFSAGVDGWLRSPAATKLETLHQRDGWRAAYLAGAKAATYLQQDHEHNHQRALFELTLLARHAAPQLDLLYAIPNGGLRSRATAGKLKAEGVKAGVPDICLPVPSRGHHGLYLELKRLDGGRASKLQVQWVESLRDQGYMAEVVKGWKHAAEVLFWYLGK